MRIGNGPRLVVPRGIKRRNTYHWRMPDREYERALAERRSYIRTLPHNTTGDVKPQTICLSGLAAGEHYRRVNGHGRSTGPRLVATHEDRLSRSVRVRRVERQEEDLHSQLSRMLKRAHRLAVRRDLKEMT